MLLWDDAERMSSSVFRCRTGARTGHRRARASAGVAECAITERAHPQGAAEPAIAERTAAEPAIAERASLPTSRRCALPNACAVLSRFLPSPSFVPDGALQ